MAETTTNAIVKSLREQREDDLRMESAVNAVKALLKDPKVTSYLTKGKPLRLSSESGTVIQINSDKTLSVGNEVYTMTPDGFLREVVTNPDRTPSKSAQTLGKPFANSEIVKLSLKQLQADVMQQVIEPQLSASSALQEVKPPNLHEVITEEYRQRYLELNPLREVKLTSEFFIAQIRKLLSKWAENKGNRHLELSSDGYFDRATFANIAFFAVQEEMRRNGGNPDIGEDNITQFFLDHKDEITQKLAAEGITVVRVEESRIFLSTKEIEAFGQELINKTKNKVKEKMVGISPVDGVSRIFFHHMDEIVFKEFIVQALNQDPDIAKFGQLSAKFNSDGGVRHAGYEVTFKK